MKAVYEFDRKKRHIIVECCNLFEQEGVRVVHAHRTFDLSEALVSSKSVAGQLVRICEAEGFDLQSYVREKISQTKDVARYDDFLPENKYVFPRGHVLRVKTPNREIYALAAFNSVKPKNPLGGSVTVPISLNEYIDFLDKLWPSLAGAGVDCATINIPLFGGRFVNIKDSQFDVEVALTMVVLSFLKAYRRIGALKNLRVCLIQSYAEQLDFEQWENSILPFLHCLSESSIGFKELTFANKGLYAGAFPKERGAAAEDSSDWQYDVFISKNQKDVEAATSLYHYLSTRGFKPFESEFDLRENGNSEYWPEIYNCLDKSRNLILLLSKNENGKNSKVQQEWERFLQDYEDGKRTGDRRLLGIIVDDTPIEDIVPEIRSRFECLYLAEDIEKIANFLN